MSRLPRPTSSSRSNCSGGDFDWEPALRKLDELNARVEDPTLWDDAAAAQAITRERSKLAASVEAVQSLERDLADAIGYAEMADEEGDEATLEDAREQFVYPDVGVDELPWEGAHKAVTCKVTTRTLGMLKELAGLYKVTLHEGEVPSKTKRAKKAVKS